jgi:hypothetical protein
VNDRSPPHSHRLSVSRWTAAGFVAAIIGTVWLTQRTIVGPKPMTSARTLRVRDADPISPFENARPGVAYVGDVACTGCHRDIASVYHSHPMGRSLAPVTGMEDGPPVSTKAGLPIEHKGVQYTIENRNGRLLHKASRRGDDGILFAETEAEVGFALGSGTRGISYLIERDGFLFQSPIAWFAQERRWDISPGYGEFSTSPDFERAIQPDCLFCHANQFRAVAGTVKHYEKPMGVSAATARASCT